MHYIVVLFWVVFYKIISIFIPKEKNSIVFGAWRGESFSDNSRYLAEYLAVNYSQYNLYWVGKKSIKDEVVNSDYNIRFLEMGKLSTNIMIMRCEYCFVSQKYHVDISKYNLLKKTKVCYLHHGTPVKKWGDDGLNIKHSTTLMDDLYDLLMGKVVIYDYYASSSELNSDVLCTAMRSCGCSSNKIIPSGTPRNDMLVNFDDQKGLYFKHRYFDYLGITGQPKVVMYLPTYRRLDNNQFTFSELTDEKFELLCNLLKEFDAIIIEKSHFAARGQAKHRKSDRIIFTDKDVNVQEMLMFTDILISDYSGAFLDFTLLDRPIIHFAYDYEFYRDYDSGLYYDISDFHAGAIASDFNQLCDKLLEELKGYDNYRERRRYVRNKYMHYEQGKACEILFNTILNEKKEN